MDKRLDLPARVARLESDKARQHQQTEEEAFEILWRYLDAELLPGAPPLKDGCLVRGGMEAKVLELDNRLRAGTGTAIDYDLLERMPAKSLAVYVEGGINARSFVASFARAFRDF